MSDIPTKALTIRQPWAMLTVLGHKTEEYRNRATMVRGPIYVHAAAKLDDAGCDRLSRDQVRRLRAAGFFTRADLPLGVILGSVEIVGTLKLDEPTEWGDYAWLLEEPKVHLVLVPAKGQLGFWDVERGVKAAARETASLPA